MSADRIRIPPRIPGTRETLVTSGDKTYIQVTGRTSILERIARAISRPVVVGNEYIESRVNIPAGKSTKAVSWWDDERE